MKSRVTLTVSGDLLDNANNQKVISEKGAFDIIRDLEKQLEEAEEVVEHYASADNWFPVCSGGRNSVIFQDDTENTYFTRAESNYYGGKRARQYFKNKKERE